jgi:FAD binding domain/Berberine and berberine like
VTHSTEASLKRRAFLAVAAGGAAAVAVPGIASAGSAATRARSGILARAAGATAADWTAFGKDLAGTLVRPGESSYATARLLFDPRFDGQRPAGVAYVASAHDVSTCLAFVRKFGVPFAVRSGGHSYAGWSGSSGLVIDVSRLKTVTVPGTTATVGAGTRLIDFYQGLAAKGRAVPGGSCATVGIAGLTLGGGIGVTARAYGLTCDSLQSVQIVTANGAVLTASPQRSSDLFWACQGGGGGNFGVATSFTFKTVPAPQPVLFSLSWPWSQAARVVAAWQSWAPHAPDAMWSNLHLAAAPGGRTPRITVGGCYLGSDGGAANLLSQLYAKAGASPSSHFLSYPQPFLTAMLIEAGCSSIGYQACHLPWYASGGKLGRASEYAKSDFFTTPLSSAGIGTLLAGVVALQRVPGAAGGVGGIALDALGGAVNRVAPGATAFVHRNALFSAQYTTGWSVGAGAAGIRNQLTWLRKYWNSMRRYASGQAYQNYVDPDLANWQQAYYGANYARLATIKQKYDPAGLFTFPQAITPPMLGRPPGQPSLEAAQMLMPASTASLSIAAISSALNEVFAAAARFSSSCATDDAPISADVIRSSRSTQEMASCASDCPRAAAISLSARTWRSVGSLS